MSVLTLSGTELRPTSNKIYAWIAAGFYGPANYRGANDVVPQAAGRDLGLWTADTRTVELGMLVQGNGATEVLAQQDFLATMVALRAIYVSSQASPVALRAYSPLYGIASGYMGLNVRWVNTIEGVVIAGMRQTMTVQFECTDSPPDWVAGS